MNNELMPAFPMPPSADNGAPFTFSRDTDEEFVRQCQPGFGINKLEYFAGVAMQGYIAKYGDSSDQGQRYCAQWAVTQAKALVAELADAMIYSGKPL